MKNRKRSLRAFSHTTNKKDQLRRRMRLQSRGLAEELLEIVKQANNK